MKQVIEHIEHELETKTPNKGVSKYLVLKLLEDYNKMTPFNMVKEFHETYGQPVNAPYSLNQADLRITLIKEEVNEVEEELFAYDLEAGHAMAVSPDYPKLTKELADLLYVVYGTAVTFGLPIDEVFAEVHRSNMSKLGIDGKPIYREDGKVLKGPNYKEADVAQFFP